MNRLIISAFGPDQPGIVSELSGVITTHGGNVEESRMIKLGSDFTIILLVTVSDEWLESLRVALQAVQSLKISTKLTTKKEGVGGEKSFNLILTGADNEGIVHKVTEYLSSHSINIEEMDTETSNAPVSGTALFQMKAAISLPESIQEAEIQAGLQQIASDLGVEISLGE